MTKTKTTTVRGLRDGQHTAGTRMLVRKIQALGADVAVAATGRVTVVDKRGERHVYVLVLDINGSTSPLAQALADLERAAWECPSGVPGCAESACRHVSPPDHAPIGGAS